MAATSLSVPALLEEIRRRRADVAALKRTIKETRQALGTAAAALEALELEARGRGITVLETSGGAGAIHGRQQQA